MGQIECTGATRPINAIRPCADLSDQRQQLPAQLFGVLLQLLALPLQRLGPVLLVLVLEQLVLDGIVPQKGRQALIQLPLQLFKPVAHGELSAGGGDHRLFDLLQQRLDGSCRGSSG